MMGRPNAAAPAAASGGGLPRTPSFAGLLGEAAAIRHRGSTALSAPSAAAATSAVLPGMELSTWPTAGAAASGSSAAVPLPAPSFTMAGTSRVPKALGPPVSGSMVLEPPAHTLFAASRSAFSRLAPSTSGGVVVSTGRPAGGQLVEGFLSAAASVAGAIVQAKGPNLLGVSEHTMQGLAEGVGGDPEDSQQVIEWNGDLGRREAALAASVGGRGGAVDGEAGAAASSAAPLRSVTFQVPETASLADGKLVGAPPSLGVHVRKRKGAAKARAAVEGEEDGDVAAAAQQQAGPASGRRSSSAREVPLPPAEAEPGAAPAPAPAQPSSSSSSATSTASGAKAAASSGGAGTTKAKQQGSGAGSSSKKAAGKGTGAAAAASTPAAPAASADAVAPQAAAAARAVEAVPSVSGATAAKPKQSKVASRAAAAGGMTSPAAKPPAPGSVSPDSAAVAALSFAHSELQRQAAAAASVAGAAAAQQQQPYTAAAALPPLPPLPPLPAPLPPLPPPAAVPGFAPRVGVRFHPIDGRVEGKLLKRGGKTVFTVGTRSGRAFGDIVAAARREWVGAVQAELGSLCHVLPQGTVAVGFAVFLTNPARSGGVASSSSSSSSSSGGGGLYVYAVPAAGAERRTTFDLLFSRLPLPEEVLEPVPSTPEEVVAVSSPSGGYSVAPGGVVTVPVLVPAIHKRFVHASQLVLALPQADALVGGSGSAAAPGGRVPLQLRPPVPQAKNAQAPLVVRAPLLRADVSVASLFCTEASGGAAAQYWELPSFPGQKLPLPPAIAEALASGLPPPEDAMALGRIVQPCFFDYWFTCMGGLHEAVGVAEAAAAEAEAAASATGGAADAAAAAGVSLELPPLPGGSEVVGEGLGSAAASSSSFGGLPQLPPLPPLPPAPVNTSIDSAAAVSALVASVAASRGLSPEQLDGPVSNLVGAVAALAGVLHAPEETPDGPTLTAGTKAWVLTAVEAVVSSCLRLGAPESQDAAAASGREGGEAEPPPAKRRKLTPTLVVPGAAAAAAPAPSPAFAAASGGAAAAAPAREAWDPRSEMSRGEFELRSPSHSNAARSSQHGVAGSSSGGGSANFARRRITPVTVPPTTSTSGGISGGMAPLRLVPTLIRGESFETSRGGTASRSGVAAVGTPGGTGQGTAAAAAAGLASPPPLVAASGAAPRLATGLPPASAAAASSSSGSAGRSASVSPGAAAARRRITPTPLATAPAPAGAAPTAAAHAAMVDDGEEEADASFEAEGEGAAVANQSDDNGGASRASSSLLSSTPASELASDLDEEDADLLRKKPTEPAGPGGIGSRIPTPGHSRTAASATGLASIGHIAGPGGAAIAGLLNGGAGSRSQSRSRPLGPGFGGGMAGVASTLAGFSRALASVATVAPR